MSHHQLDARYLLCPLPVIRTQDKIAQLHVGDTLEVLCTDPGALYDIPTWCKVHGHAVVNTAHHQGEVTVTVRVVREEGGG